VAQEDTYEMMVEAALPGIGKTITAVFVLLLIFGALSAFLVIIAGILTGNNGIVPTVTHGLKAWYTNRAVLIFIFTVVFIFPLSMLPNISKLEYSSFAAVAIIIFFTGTIIVIGVKGLRDGTATPFKDLNWYPRNFDDFFNSLPVLALAFTCQMNVFPIRAELHNNTLKRMNIVNFASMVLSGLLYFLVGFFGYIIFPAATGNILESLPSDTFNTVLRCFFVVAILFHYPVVHFAFRSTLEEVLFAQYDKPNWIRHTIETVVVISLTLVWAIQFPNLQDVFSLTGAVASFPICFILPAFCYMKLVHFKFADEPVDCSCGEIKKKLRHLLLPGFVLIMGFVVMVIAVYTSVLQLIKDSKPPIVLDLVSSQP